MSEQRKSSNSKQSKGKDSRFGKSAEIERKPAESQSGPVQSNNNENKNHNKKPSDNNITSINNNQGKNCDPNDYDNVYKRFTILTNNRFAILPEIDTAKVNIERTDSNIHNVENSNKTSLTSLVIVNQDEDKRKSFDLAESLSINDFHLDSKDSTTKVKFEKNEGGINVMEFLKSLIAGSYTNTHETEKIHEFVVRGLEEKLSVEDIATELAEVGIKTKKIFLMRNTKCALYVVITRTNHTLQEVADKARYLYYYRVKWEKYIDNCGPIQCHRCQQWGHATSNCHMPPRCLKCAQKHWTNNCIKTRETPATCANCGGPHPANYMGCKSYKEYMAAKKKQSKQQGQPAADPQRTMYVAAPQPSINYWEPFKITNVKKNTDKGRKNKLKVNSVKKEIIDMSLPDVMGNGFWSVCDGEDAVHERDPVRLVV